jgi:hypothetical protein
MTTQYKWLPREPTEEMLKAVDYFMNPVAKALYEIMWQAAPELGQESIVSITEHDSLVSKIASEMYTVIGYLYTANAAVSSSTYEAVLDKLLDIINNPEVLRSSEELLVPLE